jgi:asparagine synthase (glutamine-hydrolysing)
MFAIALWDARQGRLLLCRDRLGIKPLYWARAQPDRLLFASEPKALLAAAGVPRALNERRLAEYLVYRSVSGDETLFDGILQVEPGHMMIAADGELRGHRYWTPRVPVDARGGGPLGAVARGLITTAVRDRLVSDVPLGTITSGGIDSSLITVVAAAESPHPIDTFCVGFADPAFDERPFARTVATRVASRHHEIVTDGADVAREIERLTWAHDEPLTHPNSIPMHLLFRLAKERAGVTVLLSGEGADEVFGGYDRYRMLWWRDRLARVPGLGALAAAAPAVGKLRTLARLLSWDYPLASNGFVQPATVARLFPGLSDDPLARRAAFWGDEQRGARGLFVFDQLTYLPPLLQRQDRMSMAAGLEARVPFLDHRLVEWANRLPATVKLRGGERKALLKGVAAEWLPPEIIARRKVGFTLPLAGWLRAGGPLADRVAHLLDAGSVIAPFVARAGLERAIGEHSSGATDHSDLLWSLIALDCWHDVFLRDTLRYTRLPGASTGRPLPAPARGLSFAAS